ncbi:hypothetical protein ACNKHS_05495 [Shigella flexneri]
MTEFIDGSGECHKKTMRVINNDEAQYLAVVVPALLVAGAANAAEIYNKDGNKLNLTGKQLACITFLTVMAVRGNGDNTYARLASKAKLKSIR